MKITVIVSPYDSAQVRTRMGKGPDCFLASGLAARLEAQGHCVDEIAIDPRPTFPAEVETGFQVMQGVAEAVRGAVSNGACPLVLAGNCITSVGTVSGLSPRPVGVVWFDAHADFNTPETTTSGFLDGMGLAILTGRCWQTLAKSIPGYAPLAEDRIILAAARDVDAGEQARLSTSGITALSDRALTAEDGQAHLAAALNRLAERVEAVHLHIDLDVHDATVAPANHFQPPGGLSPARLRELVGLVAERLPVASAYLGAYDPDVDRSGVTLRSGFALIETILGKAGA